MINAISNLKIGHKLQITGILYLLLITIVVYFFISSNILIKKSSRQQQDLNSLSVEVHRLEMASKDYVYDAIPKSELDQYFKQLSPRIKTTALAENFAGIQDLISAFSNLRSRNTAIENEITALTESSLTASNDVIKTISDRLVGRNTRANVSNMERAVIVGANINTNANFRIRLLFNKLKEDISNQDSLVKFLDTLVANVTRDIELLKGTANEAAAHQAKKTNMKVKALVLEFIDNMHTLNTLEEKIISNLTAMNEAIGAMVVQSSLDLFSTIKGYFSTILAVILGAAIVGILVNFVAANTVSGSLKNLNLLFKDLADGEGDLTKRIMVKSKDETGDLAGWINLFIEKMQTLFKDVLSNASALDNASSELTAISQQMADGVRSASERFERVSSAAGEMSANMSSVAAASEQASANVSTVASAAEEMAITVGEIARNTGQARSTTSDAVEKAGEANINISKLGEAALQISKVTEAITDISEQTNLLALNATIEAARAGDAGKGFAVVANEIKELARQTAQATQEIKIRVEDIQNSSTQTVGNIQVISKVISEVDTIVTTIATAVEEQAVSTQDIAGNVAQASQGIQEVNENVAHSSQFSDQIARDVMDVNQTAAGLTENSSQVDARAKAMAELAGNLNRTVGRFKL